MLPLNAALRAELVVLDGYDQAVCAELASDGSLFEGYHPRMEAVHLEHAARLKDIIARHGWPGVALVGEEGAFAAWRIAQHAISDPPFMRWCRELLDAASLQADAPRWQFAYLDDRIRVFEGLPQRYGTQFRDAPEGPDPYPLDDAAGVEARRRDVGLPPLAEVIAQARTHPPPAPLDPTAKEARELAWRQRVGWLK